MQLSSALCFLYEKQIAHRDIKPENILLAKKNVNDCMSVAVKLCDFGFEHSWEKSHRFARQLGTLSYQSYEQVVFAKAGELSDVWSLGAVYFSILTQKMLIDSVDPDLVPPVDCPDELYPWTKQFLWLQYYDKVLYSDSAAERRSVNELLMRR